MDALTVVCLWQVNFLRSKEAMDLLMQKHTQKSLVKHQQSNARHATKFGLHAVQSYVGRRVWVCTMRCVGRWVGGLLQSRISSYKKVCVVSRLLRFRCVATTQCTVQQHHMHCVQYNS